MSDSLEIRNHRYSGISADVLPVIPTPSVLWRSLCFWIWAAYIVVILAAIPDIIVQFWFNQSLGFKTIFWTNFNMEVLLFVLNGIVVAVSIYVPFRLYSQSPNLRKAAFHFSLWIGIFAGWRFAQDWLQFLLALNGVPFGSTDPVFGKDLGFYIYTLPALRMIVFAAETWVLLGLAAVLIARYDQLRTKGLFSRKEISFWAKLSLMLSPYLNFLLYCQGAVAIAFTFLARYSLLLKDNEASGVRTGAEYIDVTGFFSYVNNYWIVMLVQLGLTIVVGTAISLLNSKFGWMVGKVSHEDLSKAHMGLPPLRGRVKVAVALLALEFLFFAGIVIRDHMFVAPNEPYVQIPYIQRHIDATLKGYQLDQVKVVDWTLPKKPLPISDLLASKTIQNAPILPGWVSYLEEPPDVQHYERMAVSDSKMVFGPMLQNYQQQQKLRPYYDFISVDGVRYNVDGEKKMFVSSVRELPSLAFLGPKEWLRYWGSAALLFTHGMGLVMSPVNLINDAGGPLYAVKDVPPQSENPAFDHEPRIYFGEGAKDDYVLTNIRNLKEFDYATEQSRTEFVYPADLKDGIPISSVFRRLIFAMHTKDVTAFLFSRYIDQDKTRVHIRRTPVLRANSIAPFLFLDTNSFAFLSDKKVVWMLNALTTSDQYPYSFHEVLGDKADERAVEKFEERMINYAEDSVKVTMDAYTGEIHFYKISDNPIVSTWAKVYPDLFTSMDEMPQATKAQLTYPLQWFHAQFDDIYKRYHQKNPIEFYNVEDLWDDADETLGSIGRGLSGFGTTDQMTFSYEGFNALVDPADMPAGVDIGKPGELQYMMLMPFTCEGCRNLRSLIVAYQDPGSYGKLVSLQIPQGEFVPGPEQIDAYIDNDRPVHQQVTMWIRHNSEVIRGSTLLLPVKGDIIYIEPIWVNSLQNEIPQIKIFAVRYHGRITSGLNVTEAILGQQVMHSGLPPLKEEKQEATEATEKRPANLPPQAVSHVDQKTNPE